MLTLVAPVFSSTEDNNYDDAYSIGCHVDNIIMSDEVFPLQIFQMLERSLDLRFNL